MKKLLFLLVALLPLLAAAGVRGDVDGSGTVDGTDLNELINILLGKDDANNYGGRADVNSDTQVDGNDLNLLINILLGKEVNPSTPPEPVTQTFTVYGVSFTMVTVEGGTFTMGATPEQDDEAYNSEKPAHQVTLSSFCIGQTEVTQTLWMAVMGGGNPSEFYGSFDRPVERVSWNDCQEFITKLNQKTGQSFRLPTEAEWEFAARGGNHSQGYKYAGSNTIGDVAWYAANAYFVGKSSIDYGTHIVATKAANELGLYDMSGNVMEWCQDWYGSYSSEEQVNPTGPDSGLSRVTRGGDWSGDAGYCRVSRRNGSYPLSASYFHGFRLAL